MVKFRVISAPSNPVTCSFGTIYCPLGPVVFLRFLKLIILVSNGDLVAASGISCEFYLLLASPSNKTIDDFSKLSFPFLWLETFQA
jgi:hypothetical protein